MGKELTTYQQQTYDYVRGQIINLGFKPGEFINDAQIAEKLSISRTPVREAFQRLEKEGLLVNEARKGWRVYMLDLEDIDEIFDLKIAIEGMLVRKAAACTDKSLRKDLAAALTDMKAAVEDDDPDAWLQADIHLHNIIFLMANNERAEQVIRTLNDQWHRIPATSPCKVEPTSRLPNTPSSSTAYWPATHRRPRRRCATTSRGCATISSNWSSGWCCRSAPAGSSRDEAEPLRARLVAVRSHP
jgi:DNA-binding GntR family transcriptional regulator